MPPGAFNRKVGPQEWLAFLDEVGIHMMVLYPTAGVASANIVNPDWAVDATRAYNDWLSETYLQHSPRFHGLALLPQALIDPQAAAAEAAPRCDQARHARRGAAVEQFARAAVGYADLFSGL